MRESRVIESLTRFIYIRYVIFFAYSFFLSRDNSDIITSLRYK